MTSDPQAHRDRSHELSVLSDVARTLNASVELSTLLEGALERVTALLGLETGWVLLLDEASGEPYLAASQNLPHGLRREPELMAGWCYCLEAFCDGELDRAENTGVITCSRLRKLALAQGDTAGLRYHASVPLVVHDETRSEEGAGVRNGNASLRRLGMLNVASAEWRQLDADELGMLRTIADVLGVAVERARLHARRLEAAQTEERNRLAREIHDTIAQDFSAIAFQLEAAEGLLVRGEKAERVLRSVSAALQTARKGLEETRRSVLELRGSPLEGRTLAKAIADLGQEARARGRAAVVVKIESDTRPLSSAVEIGVFRVAQEAVLNAVRHSDASRIALRLAFARGELRLVVEDDGRGFEPGAPGAPDDTHFGLVGMRERMRLLGGQLTVESAPGSGTRVRAAVPLPEAAAREGERHGR
jgi:two-component system NarL family sensor kinase